LTIDRILADMSWDATREALTAEPTVDAEGRMRMAGQLIKRQRDLQVDVLARLAVSPVLASASSESSISFELRSPSLTARRFIDDSARIGKHLHPFEWKEFDRLESPDAHLGRFLRLIAMAPVPADAGEPEFRHQFDASVAATDDLGLVLCAMTADLVRRPSDVRELVDNLGRRLLESEDSYQSDRAPEPEVLLKWTSELALEGSAQLHGLVQKPVGQARARLAGDVEAAEVKRPAERIAIEGRGLSPTSAVFRFERGRVGVRELQREIDAVVSELRVKGSESTRRAESAGVDIDTVRKAIVTVRQESFGIDAVKSIVINVAAATSTLAAQTFLSQVLLPILKSRFGSRALGKRL
jgi:hypothetical protein